MPDDPAAEFHYELPPELIAQDPPPQRGDSRLLLVHKNGRRSEHPFGQLPGLLRRGDLLVLNESMVLPARLFTRRADTGGRIEVLLVQPAGDGTRWLAMVRPARRLRVGTSLVLVRPGSGGQNGGPRLQVAENLGGGQVLVTGEEDLAALSEQWGVMPLPPYIKRDFDRQPDPQRADRDRRRYQTVYARPDDHGASVAAPTAGLHFTPQTLADLGSAGVDVARVRLHVGPGTFRPPQPQQIAAGRLHPERFVLPAETWRAVATTRAAGGRVIAVGTTSLRVLETAARLPLGEPGPGVSCRFGEPGANPEPEFAGNAVAAGDAWEIAGQTRLFIRPPRRVTAADGLLTNFHLPGSSLLMLVAAFLGSDLWREAYRHAVAAKMRFFSYGDCMLILPDEGRV